MTITTTTLTQPLRTRNKWLFVASLVGFRPGMLIGFGEWRGGLYDGEIAQVCEDWNMMEPVPLIRGVGKTKPVFHGVRSEIFFDSEVTA